MKRENNRKMIGIAFKKEIKEPIHQPQNRLTTFGRRATFTHPINKMDGIMKSSSHHNQKQSHSNRFRFGKKGVQLYQFFLIITIIAVGVIFISMVFSNRLKQDALSMGEVELLETKNTFYLTNRSLTTTWFISTAQTLFKAGESGLDPSVKFFRTCAEVCGDEGYDNYDCMPQNLNDPNKNWGCKDATPLPDSRGNRWCTLKDPLQVQCCCGGTRPASEPRNENVAYWYKGTKGGEIHLPVGNNRCNDVDDYGNPTNYNPHICLPQNINFKKYFMSPGVGKFLEYLVIPGTPTAKDNPKITIKNRDISINPYADQQQKEMSGFFWPAYDRIISEVAPEISVKGLGGDTTINTQAVEHNDIYTDFQKMLKAGWMTVGIATTFRIEAPGKFSYDPSKISNQKYLEKIRSALEGKFSDVKGWLGVSGGGLSGEVTATNELRNIFVEAGGKTGIPPAFLAATSAMEAGGYWMNPPIDDNCVDMYSFGKGGQLMQVTQRSDYAAQCGFCAQNPVATSSGEHATGPMQLDQYNYIGNYHGNYNQARLNMFRDTYGFDFPVHGECYFDTAIMYAAIIFKDLKQKGYGDPTTPEGRASLSDKYGTTYKNDQKKQELEQFYQKFMSNTVSQQSIPNNQNIFADWQWKNLELKDGYLHYKATVTFTEGSATPGTKIGSELVWPTISKDVNSPSGCFQAPRKGHPHAGIDIGGTKGDAVYAVADGKVARIVDHEDGDLGGIRIAIDHKSKTTEYSTHYMHLNTVAANLREGAMVKAGDVIGAVGDTGDATGHPHLHFEICKKDAYGFDNCFNPCLFLDCESSTTKNKCSKAPPHGNAVTDSEMPVIGESGGYEIITDPKADTSCTPDMPENKGKFLCLLKDQTSYTLKKCNGYWWEPVNYDCKFNDCRDCLNILQPDETKLRLWPSKTIKEQQVTPTHKADENQVISCWGETDGKKNYELRIKTNPDELIYPLQEGRVKKICRNGKNEKNEDDLTCNKAYGNYVVVKHEIGGAPGFSLTYYTQYNHLKEIRSVLAIDSRVDVCDSWRCKTGTLAASATSYIGTAGEELDVMVFFDSKDAPNFKYTDSRDALCLFQPEYLTDEGVVIKDPSYASYFDKLTTVATNLQLPQGDELQACLDSLARKNCDYSAIQETETAGNYYYHDEENNVFEKKPFTLKFNIEDWVPVS